MLKEKQRNEMRGLMFAIALCLIVYSVSEIKSLEKAKEEVGFYKQTGIFDLFRNSDRVNFEVVPVIPEISNYREWGNDNLSLMFNMPKNDGDGYALKLWIRYIDRYNAEFEQAVLFVYKNGKSEHVIGHYHPGRSGSKEEIGEMAGKVLRWLIHEKKFFERE